METEEEEVKDKEVKGGGVKEEEEDKGKEEGEDFPTEEEQEGEMLTDLLEIHQNFLFHKASHEGSFVIIHSPGVGRLLPYHRSKGQRGSTK